MNKGDAVRILKGYEKGRVGRVHTVFPSEVGGQTKYLVAWGDGPGQSNLYVASSLQTC